MRTFARSLFLTLFATTAYAHTVELKIDKATVMKLDSHDLTVRHAEKAVLLTVQSGDTQKLHDLTAAHPGEKMTLLVDGVVQAEPIIRDPIQSGRIAITLMTDAEAIKLAKLLSEK